MFSLLVVVGICLFLSAFFSGMEIAYVSSNKIHIEIAKKQGGFLAGILTKITEKPSKFIAAMLVGNSITLVVYGFVMSDWIMNTLPVTYHNLWWQIGIAGLVILITAEFLPKILFQLHANSLLKFFAIPAYFFYRLFSPISSFVIWVSDSLMRILFKTNNNEMQLTISRDELGDYITEQMEQVDEDQEVDSEIQLFQNALEFAEVKAREVMIPRTEITAVEFREKPQDLVRLFTETGYSKILVYKDTVDDIIGYVHSFEMFKKPKTIKSIMLSVEYVPETMLINDVLSILMKKRKSMAVVLDEYGGTSGIITVEDIVEELFGEIEDEHDTVELQEEQLSDAEFLFSARLEVDYLNESYKLNLPESENYETLGGLIVNHYEDIPEQGERVVVGEYHFIIEEVASTKILTVRLKIVPEE
ncbi:hemolysin family protein [Imtechella halotolerans]|uniref:Uncharacterized protein n=1 Tax=Imtechella halotolerans K1 TaxID=946077 RepID=I0WI87_9FLAO|nr:hemolysin family protein [Imtechella halotolerans]EID76103.1 hypothetical protein W5A_04134 [Imtechella halotolerans K1]WMQ63290.1 hemolysin family protein [Imtechella halotolerans]